jgi:hypothetical protein
MSKKFTSAQQNYTVHEMETLAILELLQCWEDKLVGYRIHVVMDHKALEFFKTQTELSHHQRQWMDYMSRFNFNIMYVKGELNKVADCLSHYYKNDMSTDIYDPHKYVCTDACIDPEGNDLPGPRLRELMEQVIELCAICASEHRQSQHIQGCIEECDLEAQIMVDAYIGDNNIPSAGQVPGQPNTNMMLGDLLFQQSPNHKPTNLHDNLFLQAVQQGYTNNKLVSLIKEKPQDYKGFSVNKGLIYTSNPCGDQVVCVPHNCELITQLINQVHNMLGCFSNQCTTKYL